MKTQHPKFKFLFATDDGKVYYENGKQVATNKNGTREKFVVKDKNGKCLNFGLRRFLWECKTGEVLDKKYVVIGKGDSNKFKDLQCITKSEHASKVYKKIWEDYRKRKNIKE